MWVDLAPTDDAIPGQMKEQAEAGRSGTRPNPIVQEAEAGGAEC